MFFFASFYVVYAHWIDFWIWLGIGALVSTGSYVSQFCFQYTARLNQRSAFHKKSFYLIDVISGYLLSLLSASVF